MKTTEKKKGEVHYEKIVYDKKVVKDTDSFNAK